MTTTETRESLAAQAVVSEMVAEGIVQWDHGVLVFGHDRQWMIEVKAFEITGAGEEMVAKRPEMIQTPATPAPVVVEEDELPDDSVQPLTAED